jgi:CheY-like chemotaxis protein
MDEMSEPRAQERDGLNREQGHIFKNIFSVIIANTEMVREGIGDTPQMERRLERIIEACRRGEELVNQLRNLENFGSEQAQDTDIVLPRETMPPGRVLVVDDEVDIVEIICRTLIKKGFRVKGVTDGGEAWDLLHADPFCYDLVITDLDMPLLSGADLCRKLSALRPELPVIMVTGYDRQISKKQMADLGITKLLIKPLDRHKLLTAVYRSLTP